MDTTLPTIRLSDGRMECHPLFNSAIMDNLIRLADIPTLKEIRTVCKFWHQKASARLQQLAWVKLRSVDNSNLDQFILYIETIPRNQVFFRHYEIDTCRLSHESVIAEKFVQRCCPTLISLTLKYTFLEEGFLQKLMFQWTPDLRHLSFEDCLFIRPPVTSTCHPIIRHEEFLCNRLASLHFHYSSMYNDFPDEDVDTEDESGRKYLFPFRWTEILKAFPNLRVLSLNDLNDEQNTDLLRAMREFSQSRSSDLHIESLDIFGHRKMSIRSVPYKDWELLSKLRLPFLTILNMDIGLSVDERGFARSLANFAPTLQKLQIWRGRIGSQLNGFPYDIRFPRLETLELPENCVNGLRFVNYMRRLQRLSITQCDTHPNSEATTIFNEVNTDKIRPLYTLTYILVEFYMSDVSKVERIFPNILKIFMLDNYVPSGESSSDDDDFVENDKNLSPEWRRCEESMLEVECKDV